MKNTCPGLTHPRGEATGRTIKTFPSGSRYVERICPVCGRVQGIALIRNNQEVRP